MTEENINEKVLNCMIENSNDVEDMTIREYLKKLLHKLYFEKDGFSGKRPFGNSGWEYDIYVAMARARLIDGKIDEYGDIEEVDGEEADTLILSAITYLFESKE